MDSQKDAEDYKDITFALPRKEHQKAVVILSRAIQRNPKDVTLYCRLANVLKTQGRYTESIDKCAIGMKLDPYCELIHLEMTQALCCLGKEDEALSVYERALEFLPNSQKLNHRYGVLLRRKERYDEAALTFQKVISLNTLDYDSYVELALTFFYQQKYEEAISQVKKMTYVLSVFEGLLTIFEGFILQQQSSKLLEAMDLYKKGTEIIVNRLYFSGVWQSAQFWLIGYLRPEISWLERKKKSAPNDNHVQIALDGMTKVIELLDSYKTSRLKPI